MTDPTPQTPPQGLTEDTLREQWNAQADRFNQWESLDPDEQFAWAQQCAIAADRAARVGLVPPQGLTDAQLLELAETELCIDDMQDAHEEHYPIEVVTDGLIAAMRAAIAADRAARPRPTPEEVEARFRAWWAESFPNAPAGPHAVASHVAFALHLLGGEVAA